MEAVQGFLASFGLNTSTGPIRDTLKLVVVGGTVETARRAWSGFVDSFYLTAHFSQEDYPYDWMMHWLSKQPQWVRSREFDITCSVGRGQFNKLTAVDLDGKDLDKGGERALESSRRKPKVIFKPSPGATHTVFYRGHLLTITPTRSHQGIGDYSNIKISVIARTNDILKRLVLEAKREYEKDAEHRVHIFTADAQHACWSWNGKRPKRPMSSIILEPEIKEMLLADCRNFLRSENWYAEKGIPFRRGYLLYGVPGSGKTSLISSIAGELDLDICVLILSSKGMCDNTLVKIMKKIPSRCILLLEDLDAAFSSGTTSTGDPKAPTKAIAERNSGSALSLSGLLTSLDCIDPGEGRLIFATINHVERLDPALSRPGRMDVWVNFTHATKWQAEWIFKRFFQSRPSPNGVPSIDAPREPRPGRRASAHGMPTLGEAEIVQLAQRFADAIPEGEISVASLEKYLVENKRRPRECVNEAREWVERERTTRAVD